LTWADPEIEILGQTYDHTILDIEYSKRNYLPGDVIDFEIDSTGLLAACTVENITKKFVYD
jgi:predicted amino acid racemase